MRDLGDVLVVEDGRPVPPGSEGEVVVASAAVARGYVVGAPDGRSPLEDGIFRTGDVGRMDSDGFLTLVGRRDAMINVGGLKVSPAEVSATLERHPAVGEAAVIGFPDGRDEEVVYAVVSLSRPVAEGNKLFNRPAGESSPRLVPGAIVYRRGDSTLRRLLDDRRFGPRVCAGMAESISTNSPRSRSAVSRSYRFSNLARSSGGIRSSGTCDLSASVETARISATIEPQFGQVFSSR